MGLVSAAMPRQKSLLDRYLQSRRWRRKSARRVDFEAMNRVPPPPLQKISTLFVSGLGLFAAAVSFAAFEPAMPPALAQPATGVFVPGFWDPKHRPERPESGRISTIRFLTEEDYPPFNFKGANGQPAGFNIDLARALCTELNLVCTVQVRRYNTLIDALNENKGDAVIASLAITPQNRA